MTKRALWKDTVIAESDEPLEVGNDVWFPKDDVNLDYLHTNPPGGDEPGERAERDEAPDGPEPEGSDLAQAQVGEGGAGQPPGPDPTDRDTGSTTYDVRVDGETLEEAARSEVQPQEEKRNRREHVTFGRDVRIVDAPK